MQTNNRAKIKEVNQQQLHERLKVLTATGESERNPIDDIIESPPQQDNKVEEQIPKPDIEDAKAISSIQDRFGVSKIHRPVKDGQLTARIDSKTLTRFKEIVKEMYYPDKPNINETVSQMMRAFVEEYDKNNKK